MRELEDRMIKLAGLLRDAQPDDAARLLLGVENAREQLILEQMQSITALLADIDLSQATNEQKQVLEKLQRLKDLLLHANVDLKIKLEQLQQVAEARQRIADLVAQEKAQVAATAAAEKNRQATGPLAKNEQRNQRVGQDLQRQVSRIAGSNQAAESIGQACTSMGNAAQALGQAQCQAACQAQQSAIEQLERADQQLEQLQQQLRQQAEATARQRITELLNEMIERQTQVKEATEQAVPRVGQRDAQIAELLPQLAGVQSQIMASADECIQVCDTIEFSFVLPDALRDVRGRMEEVRSELEQARADDRLVQAQDQIISDLTELLGAMQKAGKPGSPKLANSKGSGCSDRNELLAEVKLLYWMQKTVNRKTREIRNQELARELVGDELRQKAWDMKQQQDTIHKVTERLRELTDPGYVNGDAFQ
jgi:DNA repair exonuclease SbcCD ATPase subunit